MANLKEKTSDFLSSLEGYHQVLKEIHWNTTCKAEHLLTDDIDGDILDFQDRIAEYVMGKFNFRFTIGSLKTLLPSNKTTETLLDELEKDIISLKETFGDNNKVSGLHNILDEFLEKVATWKYLASFK